MSTPRFYCPQGLAPGAVFTLPEEIFRHAIRVLRLPEGAELALFDGQGGEYPAVLRHVDKHHASVQVGQWVAREVESTLKVTLVQAVQAADKMDYTLQKAVELGVTRIQPVQSRRSVVRLSGEREQKRVAHWQGVVVSACEQCGRNQVPIVAPVQPLLDWLGQPAGEATRLMLLPGAERTLADLPPVESVELLIGAEGGLDPDEVANAQRMGFIPVSLGPRVLRTETAGLAALAALQTLWGDFR